MNMWTALMHVGADFVRSVSTFVSAVLMLLFKFDTTTTDAWATLVISLTIILGVSAGIVAWLRKLIKCLRASHSDATIKPEDRLKP